jgi:hypothetical protein
MSLYLVKIKNGSVVLKQFEAMGYSRRQVAEQNHDLAWLLGGYVVVDPIKDGGGQ